MHINISKAGDKKVVAFFFGGAHRQDEEQLP